MLRPLIATCTLLLVLCTPGCTRIKTLLYEGFERDKWQMPRRVLESLELKPGAAVADIGAGSGYFTMPLARAVGPEGRVYALDVDGSMLDKVEARAEHAELKQIETVRVRGRGPGLPPRTFDLIFLCNTYHHLDDRVEYFADLRNHITGDGRIAIIEFRPEGWLHTFFGHATAKETIVTELQAAGFVLQRDFDFLPRQNFLIFVAE